MLIASTCTQAIVLVITTVVVVVVVGVAAADQNFESTRQTPFIYETRSGERALIKCVESKMKKIKSKTMGWKNTENREDKPSLGRARKVLLPQQQQLRLHHLVPQLMKRAEVHIGALLVYIEQ